MEVRLRLQDRWRERTPGERPCQSCRSCCCDARGRCSCVQALSHPLPLDNLPPPILPQSLRTEPSTAIRGERSLHHIESCSPVQVVDVAKLRLRSSWGKCTALERGTQRQESRVETRRLTYRETSQAPCTASQPQPSHCETRRLTYRETWQAPCMASRPPLSHCEPARQIEKALRDPRLGDDQAGSVERECLNSMPAWRLAAMGAAHQQHDSLQLARDVNVWYSMRLMDGAS
jgi:hypothetical protein